jgi:hypothetical protein
MASRDADESEKAPATASRRPAIAKFTVETAIAVPAPQVFPFGDGLVVTVTNWTETDTAGERHRGLLVEVALDAVDPEDAVRGALGPAGIVTSMMSFGHAAAAGPLRPYIAYAERADGGCDVAQHAQWPIEPSSRRLLKKERMEPLVARMNTILADERDRVLRALEWYRKALTETNVFDRFAAVWIGLESINPALIKRRDLPTKQTIRTCEKCGTPVVTMDTIAGITDLLERHFGEQDRRTVRRFRQDFMHSTRPLHAIVDDAAASTNTALAALRIGLLELMNATPEEIAELAPTPMRLPERNRIRYEYQARPLRIATIPSGQATPRIAMRRFVSERTQDERGRTREHIIHELETLDFTGEIPSPLAMWVAIPSADPDDPERRMQMTSVEIVSKETGEAIAGTVTELSDESDHR